MRRNFRQQSGSVDDVDHRNLIVCAWGGGSSKSYCTIFVIFLQSLGLTVAHSGECEDDDASGSGGLCV